MKSRESRESRKTNAFKVTPELDRAYKALFGPEEEESYHNKLKKSAQRVVFGKPGPISCWDCGLEDQAILEIHHILDDDSRISGNYLQRNVHGAGNEFYRYILSPEKDKPKMILLCPTCHTRRHKTGHIMSNTTGIMNNKLSINSVCTLKNQGKPTTSKGM